MRLLLLISNIVIGATLLTDSGNVFAAGKTHKSSHTSGQALYRHSKGKLHSNQLKQKENYPGDVWKRISSGIRIPRPSFEIAALSDQFGSPAQNTQQPGKEKFNYLQHTANKPDAAILPETDPTITTVEETPTQTAAMYKTKRLMKPTTAVPNPNKYTELGRKLLFKKTTAAESECDPKKSKLSKAETYKIAKTRIRTQFNFHPELHKNNKYAARTVSYGELIGNEAENGLPCAETKLNKLTRLAALQPSATDNASVEDLESRMQLLANKQRAMEAQKNAQLVQNPPPAGDNESTQSLDAQMQLLANKQHELQEQRKAKLMLSYDRVNKYVSWYAQRRNYLYEVAERARPYLFHIVEGLSRNKLPLDLALLPIVESAYKPKAQSPKSAAGLWQFMPTTGEDYNLKQDGQYDERLDIVESTQAAISYLAFLNQHFHGDWLLALAAYNCGIGRVDDAISRNIAAGIDTDYWSLQLPDETQEYVPRLLALSTLFANPENYKLKLAPVRNEPYFINVKIDRKADIKHLADKDIKTIAELANISNEHFTLLNPGYLGAVFPADGPFSFLMPIANANQLHQRLNMLTAIENNIEQTSKQFASSKTLLSEPVEPGRGVSTFTAPFLSLSLNKPPQPLNLLTTAAKVKEPAAHATLPKQTNEAYFMVHYLDKGETLQTVARQFDVSVDAMRELNKLKRRQNVALGQRLMIPFKTTTVMLESKPTAI